MYQLDALDKKILMLLQRGIPVVKRPYLRIAQEIGGLTEQEVMERIARMKDKDSAVIRRMSGFFNSGSLGYVSALCAAKVRPEHLEEVAGLVNSYPGVTHNYERGHEYNMWFTLIAAGEAEQQKILGEIESCPHAGKVLRFYTGRRYKIDVTFKLEG